MIKTSFFNRALALFFYVKFIKEMFKTEAKLEYSLAVCHFLL